MKALKKLLLIGFLSLLLTLTISIAGTKYEAGWRIIYHPGDSLWFPIGINVCVLNIEGLLPEFAIEVFSALTIGLDYDWAIGGFDAIYKMELNLGGMNIIPYVGAGLSLMGVPDLEEYLYYFNVLGGLRFELSKNFNVFVEAFYTVPSYVGFLEGLFLSAGANFSFSF